MIDFITEDLKKELEKDPDNKALIRAIAIREGKLDFWSNEPYP